VAVKFNVKFATADLLKTLQEKQELVATTAIAALRETAAAAVQEGRRDIAAAGPGFQKAGWLSGLQYRTKGATGRPTLRATATIFHKYGFAGVFEYGPTTIQGKPMLWIPTRHGAPPASKSEKELTSATVRGVPMLFDSRDPDRHRKPLYIGVKEVTIPDKFHITEIVKEHVAQFKSIFFSLFKSK
jgi:hypothetical protein